MLLYLFIIVVVLCALNFLLNYNETARILRKIPGPTYSFIVGNAVEINRSPVELFKLARKYAETYDGIYRIWIYRFGAVNIYNAADIEIVTSTTKHSDKSVIYSLLKPWLSDGLLLSNGAKWHHRRKVLTPTFHFNILRQFCMILEENSRRLVDTIHKTLGQAVDVNPLLSEFTLHSICETAMGTQLGKETSQKGKSYKQAIHELGKILFERLVKVYFYSDSIFNLSTQGRLHAKYLKIVHDFTKKVIQDSKIYVDSQNVETIEAGVNDNLYLKSKKKRTATLDLLLSAEKEGLIDEDGIQEEVDTFMFEGHDTTAVGLTFFLMLLANNKDVQDKIVSELRDILDDSATSIEALSKMRYLECCIKESLRLYPPVPFISRTITETVKLSNYTVPEGTICHIHIYDLHRREDLFKNPLKFDPDRFLPENCVGRHPYAYIPFSAGPRNCIGQKFAIYEMKSAVAAILRKYTLLPVTRPEDIEVRADLVMRNNGPVYVKFERRTE